MILLVKGQSNTITLTLSEKCGLQLPNFLFWFRNEISNEEVSLVLTDTSQFTDRYNRFTFVEPTNALLMEGFWQYEVYEQASASNTDKTLASALVEKGKIKVIDINTPAAQTVYDSQTKIKKVYE